MTCGDAFKNLHIIVQNNSLAVSPCCSSPIVPVKNIDFYNNQYLKSVRESWQQAQWHPACVSCKNDEAAGLTSRRIGSNAWYQDRGIVDTEVKLTRIDYWTGDLCNLACAICGPSFSSVWKQELKIPIETRKSVSNEYWKNLDLTDIELIHFNGGEPLLSKEHVNFIKAIPNKSSITLTYNTNGTILPTAELLSLWEECKLVHLDFSIDDIGERFEYQRYPAKWNLLVENLGWFYNNAPHNVMFGVNTTIGILNQANLDSLAQWLKENFYITKFADPVEHRTQLAKGNFSVGNNIDAVRKYLDEIDSRRGTDWKQVFPELRDCAADNSVTQHNGFAQ